MQIVNFPDYISVGRNKLKEINFIDIHENFITINNKDYLFNNLSNDGNKGGNSIVLKLFNPEDLVDQNSFDEGSAIAILKLLKYPFKKGYKRKNIFYDTHYRFLNEIKALQICAEKGSINVIEIYDSGECKIDNEYYLFYSMEVAKYDLKSFIENKHSELEFDNKVQLCLELLDGINQLDSSIFYHRDIKPDNIFYVGNTWKIADLGLVDGQDLEYKFDEPGKFIGPRGWASPEVMNKYLSENKGFKFSYDCKIDHQSDIFQLGKVFWYIFQFNAPIGNVNFFDFKRENDKVYWIIKKMLHHYKKRRFKDAREIIPLFQRINQECILS